MNKLLQFLKKEPMLAVSVTAALSLFLIFGVFFSSMFVTNDVSLIIFVPLTILLFRGAGREECILPIISMENIAAIRGSLLMPFGSPQNLIKTFTLISWAFFAIIFIPGWLLSKWSFF